MRTIDAKDLLGAYPTYALGQPALSFVRTARNTALLSAAAAPVSLTVAAPAEYAGTYPLPVDALGGGPVALRPPEVVGTGAVGAPLEARPALWAYDGATAEPARSWQWQSDGADIAGATSTTFTPGAAEAGSLVRVVETISGANGIVSSASAALAVSA